MKGRHVRYRSCRTSEKYDDGADHANEVIYPGGADGLSLVCLPIAGGYAGAGVAGVSGVGGRDDEDAEEREPDGSARAWTCTGSSSGTGCSKSVLIGLLRGWPSSRPINTTPISSARPSSDRRSATLAIPNPVPVPLLPSVVPVPVHILPNVTVGSSSTPAYPGPSPKLTVSPTFVFTPKSTVSPPNVENVSRFELFFRPDIRP